MLRLALVAVALGLSNLAAAVAIGLVGVDARTRWRVGTVFGAFECSMPVVGLLLGRKVAAYAGSVSSYIGGGVLIAVGFYAVLRARQGRDQSKPPSPRIGSLLASGAALSVDNLVVGFGLGAEHIGVLTAAVAIATMSVAMSLVGLELGHRLGRAVEMRSEQIGGAVLMVVGMAIAVGLL